MAIAQLMQQIPHATIVLPSVCLLIFVGIRIICQILSPQARRLRNLPLIQANDDVKLRKLTQQAFNQYGKNDEFYKIKDKSHVPVIIPPRYMGEMKTLPESQISFGEDLHARFNGELTGLGRLEPSFVKTVSGNVTKRIPAIMSELAEEVEYAFESLVGNPRESASITMLPAAQRIIALMSSRVFVGAPLCHDENWLHAMITHTNYAFGASESVWKYPMALRQYIAPYIKEFQDMMANRKEVERMLAPLIQARQKAAFSEDTGEFDDILQQLIQNAPANVKADVSYHAHNQLEMSVAGIHTTSQLLTQAIFNLAASPEYYPELRQELQDVLREHDTEPRTLVMTKQRLAKLIKLDSFMKETFRTHPLGLLGTKRKIMAPNGITFSNGVHLPQGTHTAVNSYHIMNDPDIYPEPEKFDGFRFAKLHAQGGINTTKYLFTTVNPEFVAFGQGTHSCPGRFFAGTEIKVALIYILLRYNIKFESGQPRPQNITRGTAQAPNGQAKVVFTPRQDAWSLAGGLE